MPWPTGPVQVGVHGENHALHAWVDTARVGEGAVGVRAIPMGSLMEALLGHKSGQGKNTSAEYDSGVLFLSPAAAAAGVYTLGGTSTGTAAGTLTDTNQTWPVNLWTAFGIISPTGSQFNVIASNTATVLTMKSNWGATPGAASLYAIVALADQNQGGTVTYGAATLTDTAKAWAVNQWRGYWLMAVGNTTSDLVQIASNTATVLTLNRNWSPQPAANVAYGILLPAPVSYIEAQRGAGSTQPRLAPEGNNNNPLQL